MPACIERSRDNLGGKRNVCGMVQVSNENTSNLLN